MAAHAAHSADYEEYPEGQEDVEAAALSAGETPPQGKDNCKKGRRIYALNDSISILVLFPPAKVLSCHLLDVRSFQLG